MKSPSRLSIPICLLLCLLFTYCKTFDITPYKCYYCNGLGRIICNTCKGVGSLTCSSCSGRVYIRWCSACSQGVEIYKEGNETKSRTCSKCHGKYFRKCAFCANGRIKCNSCDVFTRNRLCGNCNGRGIDPHKIKEYERARTEYYQNRKK